MKYVGRQTRGGGRQDVIGISDAYFVINVYNNGARKSEAGSEVRALASALEAAGITSIARAAAATRRRRKGRRSSRRASTN